ncbi:fumarylacetoacetate hydrolase family protein [Bordetella sp. 15P40C-2]|uniref:fumarylacetoacetate hydrolase family protein n=1 Tax=Bordetella sp. 15P40C-2 TaxID=2572246 RepID=UPI00132063B9|nr:fumarylacetoacetate hydrolase family protein [Bordetella sp. 15P40C-2]MVW71215.1 FAA hydrolase family protein [Bordetella sp. 15P40C-2]
MRFVSYYDQQGTIRPGPLFGDPDGPDAWVADLRHPACAAHYADLPSSMQAWVELGLDHIARRFSDGQSIDADARLPLHALRLAAPLPRPGKIVGAAFNYHDALAERQMQPPSEPVIFIKSGRTVVGPNDPVRVFPHAGDVTYEAELAVVIGKSALRVAREDAMKYVSAYCIFNDVSATSLVKADGGFVRGKNQSTSGPLGPWLVTPDELGDPYAIDIHLHIDGRLLQASSTSQMLFNIAELIEYASARMPLDPGDIIATGTPAGVAGAHQPPAWLTPGDTVSISLSGLGTLINPIAAGVSP